jgi:hypothetical protein
VRYDEAKPSYSCRLVAGQALKAAFELLIANRLNGKYPETHFNLPYLP